MEVGFGLGDFGLTVGLGEGSFGSFEEAESLVERGDIRCLDSEIGEAEYYDTETPAAVLPTLEALVDFAKNCSAAYLYVFYEGEWTHRKL